MTAIRKPPDWVGTPEVQDMLAKTIAAELRALAENAEAHKLGQGSPAYREGWRAAHDFIYDAILDRADEIERGNR